MLPPIAAGSLFLLTGISLLHLSSLQPAGDASQQPDALLRPSLLGDGKDIPQHHPKTDPQEEDDALFGDIDPRQLAKILVQALRGKDKVVREESSMELGRPQELDATMDTKRQDEDEDIEERTEDVTSRTIVATVEVQTKKPSTAGEEEPRSGALSRSEEEEQLTEEELHSLETMMKEFPRVGAFDKRDDSNSFNEVLPVNKNSDQRLKWQEETQKGLNFPSFSFVDELEKMNSLVGGAATPHLEDTGETPPVDEDSQEQMDEEVLSPEEEEARAKAEQDEMRRQAAEAQRARMEEEKLADIASDMLLRYMGKERTSQGKYRRPLSDAPEDKRSDEQTQDLDPQTIDKLIEISSKLHLPADDVVDIISDVEKKKRKDVIPETSSVNQPFPSPHKTWFHPKMAPSQDLWGKPRKPQPGLWPQKAPEGWLKPLVYPFPYYHRRPAYYPLPLIAPPRPLPWYYNPKPYTFNRYLSSPVRSYPPNSRTYPAPVNWRLLRKPVPYYTNSAPLWRFKLKAPPSRPVMQQKQWLGPVPAVAKEASRGSQKSADISNRRDGLERYIQQLVLKKAHMLD